MHENLLEDFFGTDTETLKRRGIFIVGWGFSYQAKDRSTSELICDFIFKSSTFNAGALFGTTSTVGQIPYGLRELPPSLNNFFHIAFTYYKLKQTRLVKVKWLLDLADENGTLRGFIPVYRS